MVIMVNQGTSYKNVPQKYTLLLMIVDFEMLIKIYFVCISYFS